MKSLILLIALSSFTFANPSDFTERESWYSYTNQDSTKSIHFSASLNDSILYYDHDKSHNYHHLYYGDFQVRGELSKSLSYKTNVSVFTEHTDTPIWTHDYQPYNGAPYNPQDTTEGASSRTLDKITGQLLYKSEFANIWAKLDHIKKGPAVRNSLFLNGDQDIYRPWFASDSNLHTSMPWLNIGFSTELGFVNYEHHNGQLRYQKDKDKFFHYHRIGIDLENFSLGINEGVVYGSTTEFPAIDPGQENTDRTSQIVYAIPFMPFFILEHYLGDRDNTLLGLDIEYRYQDHRVYGELMIDDLKSPLALFKQDWWGNKYAVTLGMQTQFFLNPEKDIALNTLIEWTRIEPWVYTHHKGGAYQYTNFNKSLGSDLGPNSMELYFESQILISDFGLKIFGDWVAKGTDKGSNFNDIHFTTDSEDKYYLYPETTLEYFEVGIETSYTLNKYFSTQLGAAKLNGDFEGFRIYSGLKLGL